jgi:hypothetical protein
MSHRYTDDELTFDSILSIQSTTKSGLPIAKKWVRSVLEIGICEVYLPSSNSGALCFSNSSIRGSISTQGATVLKYSAQQVTLGVPTSDKVAVE